MPGPEPALRPRCARPGTTTRAGGGWPPLRMGAQVGMGGFGCSTGSGLAHRRASLPPWWRGSGCHPGKDVDSSGVDEDQAAQVQHNVTMAPADQVAQVLPELFYRGRIDIAALGTMATPADGAVADGNSGAMWPS
jgi:hypothetical protein